MENRTDDKLKFDLNDERIGLTDIKLASFSDNIIGYNFENVRDYKKRKEDKR